jgi:hypothetical protein
MQAGHAAGDELAQEMSTIGRAAGVSQSAREQLDSFAHHPPRVVNHSPGKETAWSPVTGSLVLASS